VIAVAIILRSPKTDAVHRFQEAERGTGNRKRMCNPLDSLENKAATIRYSHLGKSLCSTHRQGTCARSLKFSSIQG